MADSEPKNSSSNVPKHLQPYVFPKGVSGNPGGRPKGTPTTVSSVLKEAMQQGGVDAAVASALRILLNPNHKHWLGTFKEVMDRTEGKVADRIHHELKRFEEGIELRDSRKEPVPLPKVLESPPVQPPVQPAPPGPGEPEKEGPPERPAGDISNGPGRD